jgi:hypothetical protein
LNFLISARVRHQCLPTRVIIARIHAPQSRNSENQDALLHVSLESDQLVPAATFPVAWISTGAGHGPAAATKSNHPPRTAAHRTSIGRSAPENAARGLDDRFSE